METKEKEMREKARDCGRNWGGIREGKRARQSCGERLGGKYRARERT